MRWFGLAMVALALSACATQDAARDSGRFVVACDFDNPPFAFIAADGTRVGRDVEMMDRVAQELHLTLEWRKLAFDDLLDAVSAGEVDAVCATLGITEERKQRVAFSEPYYETRIACLVRAGAGEPSTLVELDGKKISAGRGTTSEAALLSVLPRAVPVVVAKAPKPTRDRLRQKEIDGAVMDGPDADDLVAAHPGDFKVIAQPLAVERYAIALHKDDAQDSARSLRLRVDEALRRLRASGWLADLDRRWGL